MRFLTLPFDVAFREIPACPVSLFHILEMLCSRLRAATVAFALPLLLRLRCRSFFPQAGVGFADCFFRLLADRKKAKRLKRSDS